MTFISNDPSFWPLINPIVYDSYFIGVSGVVVIYDWVLTFGQELDLIWRHHWSPITILYICVRYTGLLYSCVQFLCSFKVPLTDEGCTVLILSQNWMSVFGNALINVIMIMRLYAMYQQSRKILIPLVMIFSTLTVFGVVVTIKTMTLGFEEVTISGYHQCWTQSTLWAFLVAMTWIMRIVWEAIASCLAVWIAVKYFCELPTGWNTEDHFTVLIKSHIHYFAFFVTVDCMTVGMLSFSNNNEANEAYSAIIQVLTVMEMFVLGPRLVLSIREHNAQVITGSDEATAMTPIAFQEGSHLSAGGVV